MQFRYSTVTDIGRRKINQDSVSVIEAETDRGPVLLAAVCDGMGGLKHGEYASSVMLDALTEWFGDEFADIIYSGEAEERMMDDIFSGLKIAALRADHTIHEFARREGIRCGTTAVVLLLVKGRYFVMNIGDSRAYLHRRSLQRLTKDQTVAQEMIDRGEMAEELAATRPENSILLQCVGLGRDITPEYKSGILLDNDLFLLCSDGFRHLVKAEDIERAIDEEEPMTKAELKNLLGFLTEENKRRGETDNITSAAIRVTV